MVSTGRRNTTILFHYHELVQRLCGRPPTERLSRSAVQCNCDCFQIFRCMFAQICTFREVLPKKAVGVLVSAALPRAVRVTEIDRHPRRHPPIATAPGYAHDRHPGPNCCAEKHRRRGTTPRLCGPIRPGSATCATVGAAQGKKRLSSGRTQVIFTPVGMPLGECRFNQNFCIIRYVDLVRYSDLRGLLSKTRHAILTPQDTNNSRERHNDP